MSEADDGRPLSRRERRLLEAAESEQETVSESPAQTADADVDIVDFEPEIDPHNPDGSLRSRRELRILREQAIEEYRQTRLQQTQAFSIEDLEAALGAEEDSSESADAVESIEAADDVESGEAPLMEGEAVETDEVEVVAGIEVFDEDPLDEDIEDEGDADADDSTDDEADEAEPSGDEDSGDADADDEDSAEDAQDEPVKAPGYSFPDIAPLDEFGSVFDDPAARSAAASRSEETGDFDDLITRAVAQEGAGGSTSGTAALILPDMGHTGQLSGPLGETGELFITGSVELPKSLGETGGHAGLIDALDDDADDFVLGGRSSRSDDGGIAPVLAANAVSARSKSAVVTKPEKEKSRLPVVLIATGGGLLVVIAGLAIWAASTGFFS